MARLGLLGFSIRMRDFVVVFGRYLIAPVYVPGLVALDYFFKGEITDHIDIQADLYRLFEKPAFLLTKDV